MSRMYPGDYYAECGECMRIIDTENTEGHWCESCERRYCAGCGGKWGEIEGELACGECMSKAAPGGAKAKEA